MNQSPAVSISRQSSPAPSSSSSGSDVKVVIPKHVDIRDIRSSIRVRPIVQCITSRVKDVIAFAKEVTDGDSFDLSEEGNIFHKETGDNTDNEVSDAESESNESETESIEKDKVDGDGEFNYPSWVRNGKIPDYQLKLPEFETLIDRLPRTIENYNIKYELFDQYIYVRTRPGAVHGRTVGVISYSITTWSHDSTQPGLAGETLRNFSDSNYRYHANSSKSPDLSFTPKDISIPPAMAQPNTAKPGYAGLAFPTVVIEVAHKHESWQRLFTDGQEKAFSRNTSVQILIGIKIYTSNIRAFWGKRKLTGRGMDVMRVTPKIKLDRPTGSYFLIPSALIYWGTVAPLFVGSNFRLKLEEIRKEVSDLI